MGFNRKKLLRWRPNLFLFLVLSFDLIFVMTGACNSQQEVERKGYRSPCKRDYECRHDFRCDLSTETCECHNKGHPRLNFFYNKVTDKCVSAVGKICTLTLPPSPYDRPSDRLLPPIDCVPYANCVRMKNSPLANIFGTCICIDGAKETLEHICNPTEAILVKAQAQSLRSEENVDENGQDFEIKKKQKVNSNSPLKNLVIGLMDESQFLDKPKRNVVVNAKKYPIPIPTMSEDGFSSGNKDGVVGRGKTAVYLIPAIWIIFVW